MKVTELLLASNLHKPSWYFILGWIITANVAPVLDGNTPFPTYTAGSSVTCDGKDCA
jgi:hypothetical protein